MVSREYITVIVLAAAPVGLIVGSLGLALFDEWKRRRR